jgi:hypothetical protein
MVVAGTKVDIGAQTASFSTHNQGNLGVCLEPGYAECNVGTDTLQFRGPVQVALLVEAGLDSITQATCLPCSAALMSDLTNGVSSPMR